MSVAWTLRAALLLAAIAGLFWAGAELRSHRGEGLVPDFKLSLDSLPLGEDEGPGDSPGAEIDGIHRSSVVALAYAPDGATLASGSADGAIVLWRVEDGKPIARLDSHSKAVTGLAFSPDGMRLVSSSEDGSLRLWTLGTNSVEALWVDEANPIQRVATTRDGRTVAAAARDGTVLLLPTDSPGQAHAVLAHDAPISALGFVDSGKGLSVMRSGGEGESLLWRWDLQAGELERSLAADTSISQWTERRPAALAGGSRRYAWAEGDRIKLADLEAVRDRIRKLDFHAEDVSALAFSPDGKVLASAEFDKDVALWDPVSGKVVEILHGHILHARALAFSPDGSRLATGSADRSIRLWDVETGRLLNVLGQPIAAGGDLWALKLVSSSQTQRISRWSANEGFTFLSVKVRLTNKLDEPNLFYSSGLRVFDGERYRKAVGIGSTILSDDGSFIRFFVEAKAGETETFVFVVKKRAARYLLHWLDLPPIAVQ